ncbi:hypothetical protein KP79_PYT22281 [Mizuhopecten yessoensis]|uniref:Uncharacterized protein n=1 Tax=Mizuhopecten yessoensis TaxID=6573 RepID=A0A210QDI6_MIZYE|nr:hypothetical protein KP79_PYT22281 [Mizuhopecten yessoensis]
MVQLDTPSCFIIVIFLVLLTHNHNTQAYTFQGYATVTTTVTGRPFSFCDYKGIRWTKGTIRFANHCEEATCVGGRMYGVGYGINAGVMVLEGCSIYKDGCNPLPWTEVNGANVTCFSHELIPGMNVQH